MTGRALAFWSLVRCLLGLPAPCGSTVALLALQAPQALQSATPTGEPAGLWVPVGLAGLSGAGTHYTSLALDATGTAYLAFEGEASGSKATVMRFDGSTWQTIGRAGFSSRETLYASLALSPGSIAYRDYGSGYRATVTRFLSPSFLPLVLLAR